jgi:Cupin
MRSVRPAHDDGPTVDDHIRDYSPLTLICQTHGSAAIVGDDNGTVLLQPGDVALAGGTQPYVYADTPATNPMIVIHPGQRCTTLSGETLKFEMAIGSGPGATAHRVRHGR